jgi:hypothetical protein
MKKVVAAVVALGSQQLSPRLLSPLTWQLRKQRLTAIKQAGCGMRPPTSASPRCKHPTSSRDRSPGQSPGLFCVRSSEPPRKATLSAKKEMAPGGSS